MPWKRLFGGKKGGKKERAAAATAAAAAAAPPAPKYAEPPPPLQQKKLGTSVLHGMIKFDQGLPGPSPSPPPLATAPASAFAGTADEDADEDSDNEGGPAPIDFFVRQDSRHRHGRGGSGRVLEDDGDDESSSDSDGESVAIAAASTAALAVRTNSSRSNASNMTDFGSEATETSDDDELTGAERPAAAAYGFDEGMLHGLAEEYGSGSEATGGRKTPANRRLGASTGVGSSPGGFPHAYDSSYDSRTDHFGGYGNSSSPPRENYGFAAVGIVGESPDVATPPGDRSILIPQQEEQTDGFGDGDEGLAASPSQRLPRGGPLRRDSFSSYKGFDDSQPSSPVRGAVAGTLPTAAGVRQDGVEIVLTPSGRPVLRLFWGYGESSTDPPVGGVAGTTATAAAQGAGSGSSANWIVRPGKAQRLPANERRSALRKPNAKPSDSMVRFDIDGVVEMPGSELEMPGRARTQTPPPVLSETEDPAVCLMQKHLERGRITIRQFSRIAMMLFEAARDPAVQMVRSKMLAPGTSDQEHLHIVEVLIKATEVLDDEVAG